MGRGGAVGILSCLTWASLILTLSQRASPETLGGWLPTWVAIAPMPAGFARDGRGHLLAVGGGMEGPGACFWPWPWWSAPFGRGSLGDGRVLSVLGVGALVLLAGGGMPLYAVWEGRPFSLLPGPGPLAAVPAETYRIVTQPVLPSIPLFALAGVVLARGGA